MYDDPTFQFEMKAQDTSNTRSQPTTATEQSLLYDKVVPPNAMKLSNSTLILLPFGLIALWSIAIVGFNLQKKQQRHGSGTELRPRQFHAVPCRRCAFFKDNPYLKCAINPVNALTVNAIDCTDYTPQTPQKK
jgi:hypothetical protein